MNYRPYPDVDRALAQVERGRVRPYHYIRQRPDGVIEETHIFSTTVLADFSRAMERLREQPDVRPLRDALRMLTTRMPSSADIAANASAVSQFLAAQPRRTGRTAIMCAITDETVKAGEHVHVAGRDGVRCASGDAGCNTSRGPRPDFHIVDEASSPQKEEPPLCPSCGHAPHAPGTECWFGVDHGTTRWHHCLCLAAPGASKACPPQMDCQGGTLGYADIVHLRAGGSLRGADGVTITPDVLAEPHTDQEVNGQ